MSEVVVSDLYLNCQFIPNAKADNIAGILVGEDEKLFTVSHLNLNL